MPDYDLYGLSWRSFEQLVQALAGKFIGPRIVIFGDGADGGREATYEGRIPYPADEDPWEGYLVVQAKFRQRPAPPGGESDSQWALGKLRGELSDFADPEKRRRTPDYYIYATNVVMSPAAEIGAKDKARDLFQEFAEKVPVRDFDIWDYDKIRTFLDNAEDIRRAYGAWITPGDVLAQVMEWFEAKRPDFEQVMANFLQKELAADQNVRLDQAGHTTDQPTPLAKVFVDLRASDELTTVPPEDEKEGATLPPGIVAQVLEMGAERLDPRTLAESAPSSGLILDSVEPVPGRLVLVGGPGQGKTTVSQYIAQLYRAAILKERPTHEIDAQIRPVLAAILSQCESEGMPIPASRRFPIRVVLSEFADALTGEGPQGVTSLLSYLLKRIETRTDRQISLDDLRAWLAAHPWVILLDGLDEVPTSSNRDEVLEKISEFWVDATQCNADLLVIATTRPQGYHGEFKDYYRHCYLTPLSTARAIHYGKRFASVRHAADEDRRQIVVTRLQAASENDATSRLMRSPLQVTIMATLVAQVGEPPRERWSLFKKYYDILYDREVEKGTPLSQTLLDHKTNVDPIHQRVGLQLQIESECRGTAEARLSLEQFRTIVLARLREEGFPDAQVETLAAGMIEAATERLVFLVGLESDRIGFEIRSLQEFMAAEALMNEGDELVAARLRKIAPLSHWRNAFLFAAGKCFTERQNLRDTIYTICCELNEAGGQGIDKTVLTGSQLALELLEDGTARRQPKYCRLLTRLALRMIELPPSPLHARIAQQYHVPDDSQIEETYRETLEQQLSHSAPARRLGAWATVLRMLSRGIPLAEELANSHWPVDVQEQLDIFWICGERDASTWIADRFTEAVPKASPKQINSVEHCFRFVDWQDRRSSHDWLEAVRDLCQRPSRPLAFQVRIPLRVGIATATPSPCHFRVISACDGLGTAVRIAELRDPSPDWTPYVVGARFLLDPNKLTLASELRKLGTAYVCAAWQDATWVLPWPLLACVRTHQAGGKSLADIATAVEEGRLGDFDDWRLIERSWQRDGLTEQDLQSSTEHEWLVRETADRSMFPLALIGSSVRHSTEVKAVIDALLALQEGLPPSLLRGKIRDDLVFFMFGPLLTEIPEASRMREILIQCTGHFRLLHAIAALPWGSTVGEEWLCALNEVGKEPLNWKIAVRGQELPDNLLGALRAAFAVAPAKIGLLPILAAAVVSGQTSGIPLADLHPASLDQPHLRAAAITLILAQEDWENCFQPAELLGHLVQLGQEDPNHLDPVVAVMSRQSGISDAGMELLVSLVSQLDEGCWEKIGSIIRILEGQVGRRTSGFHEPTLIAELRLPTLPEQPKA